MDWKEYENITAKIYAELNRSNQIKILGVGNDCKVIGQSSVEHQIDVLFEHHENNRRVKTAIECKFLSKNVNKDPVMKLAEIIDDAKIDFGVIVSQKGFTDDAIKFAQYKNISLIELRKPTDKDWEGKLRDSTFNVNLYVPFTYDINIDAESAGNAHGTVFGSRLVGNGWSKSLYDVMNERCQQVPWMENDVIDTTIAFDSGCQLMSGDLAMAEGVRSISFKIKKSLEYSNTQTYKGDDLVAFYLKNIFENEELHIHKCGSIKVLQ